MRIHRVGTFGLLGALLAGALSAGCGGDTVLRLTVLPGALPRPAALRLTVSGAGVNAAARRVAPVTLPGTVVVRGLPAAASRICVAVEGLDAADTTISQGATTVTLATNRTTSADVTLGALTSAAPCDTIDADLGAPADDLGPPADLAGTDAGAAICPAGATFCDDFETNDTSHWTLVNIKRDLGSELRVQSARTYHGQYALEAVGSGAPGAENQISVEKRFPAMAPPFALRTMLYSVPDLSQYTMVMSIYDATINGFSLGGDNSTTWALTEDQTTTGAPDRHTTTVSTGGRWHCLELVVDAAGNFTGYIDGQALIGPFMRHTAGAMYTNFNVGLDRTVVTAGSHVFVDDFAMGPSRLYCP